MNNGISPTVTSFLRDHIGSIEILEVLLLFHREPATTWTSDAAAAELRIQPRSTAGRCAALLKIGLLKQQQDAFQFDGSSSLARVVEELAEAYRIRRVTIIEMIFSKPVESSRLFADAFVLRKGGGPDG